LELPISFGLVTKVSNLIGAVNAEFSQKASKPGPLRPYRTLPKVPFNGLPVLFKHHILPGILRLARLETGGKTPKHSSQLTPKACFHDHSSSHLNGPIEVFVGPPFKRIIPEIRPSQRLPSFEKLLPGTLVGTLRRAGAPHFIHSNFELSLKGSLKETLLFQWTPWGVNFWENSRS